jgi:hypothetical protein
VPGKQLRNQEGLPQRDWDKWISERSLRASLRRVKLPRSSRSRGPAVRKQLLHIHTCRYAAGSKSGLRGTALPAATPLLPYFGRSGNKHKPCRDGHPRKLALEQVEGPAEWKFNRPDDNPAKVK